MIYCKDMADIDVISVRTSELIHVCGRDIMKARFKENLSRREVCEKMNDMGFSYYPVKLYRHEIQQELILPSDEARALIKVLNKYPAVV